MRFCAGMRFGAAAHPIIGAGRAEQAFRCFVYKVSSVPGVSGLSRVVALDELAQTGLITAKQAADMRERGDTNGSRFVSDPCAGQCPVTLSAR